MSGNEKIIIDECFNIKARPKTVTKDTCNSIETDFIDDNDNVLLKMENSGTLNVKYMIIFDGFPLQVHLLQSPEETCII